MSDDCISRQAVFDLMRSLTRWCVRSEDGKFNNVELLYDDVMFGIDKLLSVTPKPIITNKSAVFWLENITEKYLKGDTFEDRQMKKSINKAIKALSKEPKTGHWIYKQYGGYPEQGNYHCSECDNIDNRTPAYCPHCGCCMFKPKERSEE